MASRYRWRQRLLGSLQGQLQLATYSEGITIERSIKVTPGDANQFLRNAHTRSVGVVSLNPLRAE